MSLFLKARRGLRNIVVGARLHFLKSIYGYDIGNNCRISFSARLDKTNPGGIHIGSDTGIALGAVILTHDFVRNEHLNTVIGRRCMIGANAIICPGVSIGDGCIIGPGAVVTVNLPPGSLAVGNPARIIEREIVTGRWGVRIDKIAPHRLDPKVVLQE